MFRRLLWLISLSFARGLVHGLLLGLLAWAAVTLILAEMRGVAL